MSLPAISIFACSRSDGTKWIFYLLKSNHHSDRMIIALALICKLFAQQIKRMMIIQALKHIIIHPFSFVKFISRLRTQFVYINKKTNIDNNILKANAISNYISDRIICQPFFHFENNTILVGNIMFFLYNPIFFQKEINSRFHSRR